MTNDNGKVVVKVVSPRGHDVLELDPDTAVQDVGNLVQDGKWLFIDGQIVEDPNKLTVDDLVNAEAVTMTNQLVGG